jgi:hypothetical protein
MGVLLLRQGGELTGGTYREPRKLVAADAVYDFAQLPKIAFR